MMWPAFWGTIQEQQIRPLNPEEVYDTLRRTLRVRRDDTWMQTLLEEVELDDDERVELLGEERGELDDEELTDQERSKLDQRLNEKALEEFRTKLAEGLAELKESLELEGGQPVYVAGGKAYRLGENGQPETFDHAAAEPYAWKLAHDVRPARASVGADGHGATDCFACHSAGAPIFEGEVTAVSTVPQEQPVTRVMHDLAGYDKTRLDAWNLSFLGRTAFKWLGFISMGIVGLLLVAYTMRGLTGVAEWGRGAG
jgi:hypothetical protein